MPPFYSSEHQNLHLHDCNFSSPGTHPTNLPQTLYNVFLHASTFPHPSASSPTPLGFRCLPCLLSSLLSSLTCYPASFVHELMGVDGWMWCVCRCTHSATRQYFERIYCSHPTDKVHSVSQYGWECKPKEQGTLFLETKGRV